MKWQTAPVDGNGTQLGYLDSGAPPTPDYTTYVIIHGHTFHAPVFSPLFAHAHKYNARIVALNRRDYVNSTPFSETELNALAKGDEAAHKEFLRSRGLEIARFLCWVINELRVPRSSTVERKTKLGGLSLIGWSLGNYFTIAFLAHLDTYPAEVVQALEPYLTKLTIYAPPYMSLGYPHPENAYNPFYVPENPKRVAPSSFALWVTSYFTHPAYSSPRNQVDLTAALFTQHTPEHPYRPATIDTIPESDRATLLDLEPNARSERFYLDMSFSMLHHMLEKALLADDKCLLPNLDIQYVYGMEDAWLMTWTTCEFERDLEKWRSERRRLRPIEVIPVPSANHMIHWDSPEVFLRLITESQRVKSRSSEL